MEIGGNRPVTILIKMTFRHTFNEKAQDLVKKMIKSN